MTPSAFFAHVLNTALAEVAARGVPIYTFSFYHDHEGAAVSVCIDTEESSKQAVASMNRYYARHFSEAVADGDLDAASLWQANVGRSLSLGDFALVNLARTSLNGISVNAAFYVAMVQSLLAVQTKVAALAPKPELLILTCSGANEEVAYVWSCPQNA